MHSSLGYLSPEDYGLGLKKYNKERKDVPSSFINWSCNLPLENLKKTESFLLICFLDDIKYHPIGEKLKNFKKGGFLIMIKQNLLPLKGFALQNSKGQSL